MLASIFAWYEAGFGLLFLASFLVALLLFVTLGLATNLLLRLKFVTGLPGFKWYETMHLTGLKMEFFNRSLNPRVRYARHALALDECRADFDRVPWINDSDAPAATPRRDPGSRSAGSLGTTRMSAEVTRE